MSYQFSVGCSLSNLKGIRQFVRTTLSENRVPELQVGAIVLALDEMCSNLMIHGHHCNPEHILELHIHYPGNDLFIFEIIDGSSMFDINQFSEPEMGNLIHEKRKGGLGIRLVKLIMDKIEYTFKDGKTICRLTKVV